MLPDHEGHSLVRGDAVHQKKRALEAQENEQKRKRKLVTLLVVFFCLLFAVILAGKRSSKPEQSDAAATESSSAEGMDDGNFLLNAMDDHAIVVDDAHNCTAAEIAAIPEGSYERLFREANCGTGYKYLDANGEPNRKPVKVLLYGPGFKDNIILSGCHAGGGHCKYHPRCNFVLSSSTHDANGADVLIVSTFDAGAMSELKSKAKASARRVLYWREPYWPNLAPEVHLNKFDLEMGVHFTAGVINPNYLRKPRTLLMKSFFEFLPFEKRENFAMSIISKCNAHSMREVYIDHLSDYLGAHRVHRYGACGDRKLPPPPISRAARIIARYKFYLSFENNIQRGYVSEKLFTVLNMPLVPVYLGAFNVPNITTTPSFINVHDFKTPKELAQYLLWLNSNPNEYAKYHAWRTNPRSFSEEYLELIKYKYPSKDEMTAYAKGFGLSRKAACCRLCNLEFLDSQIAKRQPEDVPTRFLYEKDVNRFLFAGGAYRRPGPKARLDAIAPGEAEEAEPDKSD